MQLMALVLQWHPWVIKLNSGQPANFLDRGGGATAHAIEQAFQLITNDPKVTAIFVNISGSIFRCDAIAKGLVSIVESMNLRIPIVARLQGTNMHEVQRPVGFLSTLFQQFVGARLTASYLDHRIGSKSSLSRICKMPPRRPSVLKGCQNGCGIFLQPSATICELAN
jgi:hypothetical protein